VPQNDAALQEMTVQGEQEQEECASAPPKN
jgi:hypothetical protein